MLGPGSTKRAQIAVLPETVLCDVHKHPVNLFCSHCKDLVCNECIVDKHNGHNFKRVKDIVGEKRQELTRKLNHIEIIEVPGIKQVLEETKQKGIQQEKNNKELTETITSRADELVSGVNKARDNLLRKINTTREQTREKVSELENKLENMLIEKKEIFAQCRRYLTSSNDVGIVKMASELDKQPSFEPNQLGTDKIRVKRNVFIPGNTESLGDVFGQCMEQEEDVEPAQSVSRDDVTERKLEVISEFQHGDDVIMSITAVNNKTAWISQHRSFNIKHVNTKGETDKTLTFNNVIVVDLATTADGSVLVAYKPFSLKCADDQCKIKKIKRNGKIVQFVDTKPLWPCCICTSPTGHFYVGCADGYNYDVTSKNVRIVMKLSSDGRVLKKIQFDERGERLFTRPIKVQTNDKGMLWVRDRTAQYKGRVVVLHNQDNDVRFVYNGVKNNRITEVFNPAELTSAGDGTMLISDINNYIIHAVDENGVLLYLLGSTYQTGLAHITTICFHKEDKLLWVGNLEGHVQVLKF